MATCEVCAQEMTTADSCREWQARIAGKPWTVLRYGDEPVPEPFEDDWDSPWEDSGWEDGSPFALGSGLAPRAPAEPEPWPDRCGDCHVALGGHHHPGCDLARCPRCERQLISCGCWDGEVLVPQT